MHTRSRDGSAIPYYIGRSKTVARTPGVLSANLARLATDTPKFSRWDDNYAYHVGN
jgi:hypothetical protein